MINETFVVGNMPHTKDRRCNECWAGYPKLCVCKGFIHAQFIKESWNGDLNLEFLCDNCGKDYKEFRKEQKKFHRKSKRRKPR